MDSGIFSYIRAFGVRWFVAMSGPLSVPLAVIAFFVTNGAAKIILFATALFCAVFASFWIWKVEREARIAAESKANNQENMKIIKITLGRFIPEAETLMTRCRDVTISPPNDDANAWAQQVEDFLLSNLDESYIPRFRDGSNVIPMLPPGMSSQDHIHLYRDLQIRVARLNEFIKTLSTC